MLHLFMKNSYVRQLLSLLFLSFLFASCKVEFSPNAEWQEIPAVYCALDQDDDTTYVRVQKCYLGQDNAYNYTTIYDSINYPEGSITVQLEEWNATKDADSILHAKGDAPRKVYQFAYKLCTNKDSGLFCSPNQPIYVCDTKGKLDSTCLYRLVVLKTGSGDTLAKATTQLLWGNMTLSKPNNSTKFDFAGVSNKVCQFSFSALQGGRRYQPMIRFYYRDYYLQLNNRGLYDTIRIPHSIDIDAGYMKSTMRSRTETYEYSQGAFLSAVLADVKSDKLNKNVVDTVDIYMRACNEDLALYLYGHELNGSINQSDYTHTNIVNGNSSLPAVGVFASRRTHIVFTVQSPGSANSSYKKALDSLHVGFGGCF
jgi:hypothetical protein